MATVSYSASTRGIERGERTRIWILREAKALGSSSLSVVDKAEVDDGAGAAEDVADLLFRESCRIENWLAGGTKGRGIVESRNTDHREYFPQRPHGMVALTCLQWFVLTLASDFQAMRRAVSERCKCGAGIFALVLRRRRKQ